MLGLLIMQAMIRLLNVVRKPMHDVFENDNNNLYYISSILNFNYIRLF